MRNLIYSLSVILSMICFTSSCSDIDEPIIPILDPPALASSNPANGSTIELEDAESDLTIVLTYNQNIFSPTVGHSSITIDNASITSVEAKLPNLTIKVSGLVKGQSYKLTVPAGVVVGPTKVGAPEVIVNFTVGEENIVLNENLCTPAPLTQATNVFHFLLQNYRNKIVSGAMAKVNWNTDEADRVYRWTGKYPALNCFDYVHHYASWMDYSDITVAKQWWNNNGLIAAGWHWNVPASEGSSDYGFYYTGKNSGQGETSFDITKAVQDGTTENTIIKADLDKIAGYLLLLQAENIPVIWRPLHEASGGWFWWGAKGATPYKALWKLMFETFAQKGVNNLIWVWTSEVGDDDWYPGDAYVDIIGRDAYNKTTENLTTEYASLQSKYSTKMITLSECGNVSDISDQWNNGALWSWFMPWYDYNATDNSVHQYATKEFWIKAFDSGKVISRDQMPSLK